MYSHLWCFFQPCCPQKNVLVSSACLYILSRGVLRGWSKLRKLMILVGNLDKKIFYCIEQKKLCVWVHSLRAAGYFYRYNLFQQEGWELVKKLNPIVICVFILISAVQFWGGVEYMYGYGLYWARKQSVGPIGTLHRWTWPLVLCSITMAQKK